MSCRPSGTSAWRDAFCDAGSERTKSPVRRCLGNSIVVANERRMLRSKETISEAKRPKRFLAMGQNVGELFGMVAVRDHPGASIISTLRRGRSRITTCMNGVISASESRTTPSRKANRRKHTKPARSIDLMLSQTFRCQGRPRACEHGLLRFRPSDTRDNRNSKARLNIWGRISEVHRRCGIRSFVIY